MKTAKAYGAANVEVFKESEVAADAASGQKTLWIVMSSDRGLCGGIHSSVAKRAKKELTEEAGSGELSAVPDSIPVVVLGDKPKQQLGRALPNNIVLSFNQIGRQVPSFADACAIADQIEEMKVEYDNVKIIYNKVRRESESESPGRGSRGFSVFASCPLPSFFVQTGADAPHRMFRLRQRGGSAPALWGSAARRPGPLD